MTRPRHGRGHVPADVRQAIRTSPESLRVLAARYGINPKTVAKWKARGSADDLPSGPRGPRQGGLSAEDEDIIVRFREHTLLPLDDCLYALQAQIPHLSRSALHRCLQRHGISRLARTAQHASEGAGVPGGAVLGCLHVDRSVVQSGDGARFLFNAIDQASKFVFVRMGPTGGAEDAEAFLAALVERLPFRLMRIVTPDAPPFAGEGEGGRFTSLCRARGIDHQLSSGGHPWSGGSGARIGRLIEGGLTFASADDVEGLLRSFVHAYNFRRRLKTLRGQTPHEYLCRVAERHPELFHRDPHHEIVGLEIIRA